MSQRNQKAIKFQEFLAARQITCFADQETGNEINTVVFRANLDVGGQHLPLMLVTDDSIYTLLQVRVAAAVQDPTRPSVLAYINELNKTYKLFKYFIGTENELILACCLPATAERFEPELVSLSIDLILQHLQEEYPVIMRKLWAAES